MRAKGLRLIEVDKADLVDLPDIADLVAERRERFIVFCDDLTFDAGEPGYKALKVMLDGTIAAASPNMLIYATSNRRHLLPEYFSENLETKHIGEEVHPGESVEEKISLSERFGLWISFYPFSQDDYLAAVARWLAVFGVPAPKSGREARRAHRDALQFALQRGSRSGRIAWQFARGYAGAAALLEVAPRVTDVVVRVAAAVVLRPDGKVLLAQRPHGKALRRLLGVSRRQARSRAKRRATRSSASLREELGIDVRRAIAVARPALRLSARARRAPFLSRVRDGRASRSATTGRRSRGRLRAHSTWRRCFPRTRSCCAR